MIVSIQTRDGLVQFVSRYNGDQALEKLRAHVAAGRAESTFARSLSECTTHSSKQIAWVKKIVHDLDTVGIPVPRLAAMVARGAISFETPDGLWFRVKGDRVGNHGKLTDGKLFVRDQKIVDHLLRFEADPEAVALEYSKIACSCCFCRRPLTSKESTHHGYGPICADQRGLPWAL